MASTLSENLERGVKCTECGEVLTAPAWSGQANAEEVRNLGHCSNCGYGFETLDPFDEEAALPTKMVEEFLPGLVVE